jgi:hypothetical protein
LYFRPALGGGSTRGQAAAAALSQQRSFHSQTHGTLAMDAYAFEEPHVIGNLAVLELAAA